MKVANVRTVREQWRRARARSRMHFLAMDEPISWFMLQSERATKALALAPDLRDAGWSVEVVLRGADESPLLTRVTLIASNRDRVFNPARPVRLFADTCVEMGREHKAIDTLLPQIESQMREHA